MILAFDTSGPWVAAALLGGDALWDTKGPGEGGALLAARALPMERGQAEALLPLLEALLAEAGADWTRLTALACGTGPGNFTGTRISVAAARALALALDLPAIGISLLEAAALDVPLPCLVALDARRGEAYVQRFGGGATGPALLDAQTPLPAEGCASLIGDAPALAALVGAQGLAAPELLAGAIARLAARRLRAEQAAVQEGSTPPPLPRPAPLYLRAADAAPPRDPPPPLLP